MSIDDFTIRCTEEQTKKALQLGVQIKWTLVEGNQLQPNYPTAEQMIGWIEGKGLFISIQRIKNSDRTFTYYYAIDHNDNGDLTDGLWTFDSRKKATLAAIDAVLEYLEKKK